MKGMNNLIRVQKWKLDEKRRAVGDLEGLLQGFRDHLARLDLEQQSEQQIVENNPDAGFAYSNYLAAARQRRENLVSSIQETEQQLASLQEEVAEIFQELKKYEISEETRLRLLKEQQEKRLQEEMDALSIDMYRRKSV